VFETVSDTDCDKWVGAVESERQTTDQVEKRFSISEMQISFPGSRIGSPASMISSLSSAQSFGSSAGKPFSATTPVVRQLRISGTAVEKQELRVIVEYRGGIEGTSRIQWQRSLNRIDWCDIPGATSPVHQLSHEDVGCTVRVCYVPVRVDGVAGSEAYAETECPIQPCHPCIEVWAVPQYFIYG